MVFAFWNVENLYDTIDDPSKDDDEFTPQGKLAWTSDRYQNKIKNLAHVISSINAEVSNCRLGLMGLCEIENMDVLTDLVRSPAIKELKLTPLLVEGPDARGVDVALLYKGDRFEIKKTCTYSVQLPLDTAHKTRDILIVSGMWDNAPLCIMVNHWPSRRGGETLSRPNRIAAAQKLKHVCDSVHRHFPGTRVLIMGDFNDDPVDISLKNTLGTVDSQKDQDSRHLFNPFEKLYRKGIGTLAWRDSWNLFDQILLNSPFKDQNSNLVFSEAVIFNKKFLTSDLGNYRNYPFRTYSGGAYTGGYSDHYPVFIVFKTANNSEYQPVK